MKRTLLALFVGIILAALPLVAHAEDGDKKGFTLRVDGDFALARSETIGTAIVINGDAQIDGTVSDALVVIEGTATVTGTIEGDVTVINGTLNLRNGSSVDNVNLVRSDLNRDEGARVSGDIHRRENFAFRGAWAVFSILFWVGFTIFMLAAAALFAAIGGRQLKTASQALTQAAVNTIVGAVFLWIGGPILAVLLFITVVGIPIGLGIFLFVLPVMGFLGYIVAGTRLGTWIAGLFGGRPGEHPYVAALLGVLVLQLIVLIPAVGWLIGGLAALWGSGALAFLAFRAARGHPAEASAAEPAVTSSGSG